MPLKRFFIALPLALSSCATFNSSPKDEKHQMELTISKFRSDIEELRHDLNSHQMEMHILEGKIATQENSLSHMRTQSVDQQQIRIDQMTADVMHLEKELKGAVKKLDQVLQDIRQLSLHANETTSALTQYKEKIRKSEERLEELGHIKAALGELKVALQSGANLDSYTVQSGDTLEKIARKFQTTISSIKSANDLTTDTIYPGQELSITSE